MLIKTREKSVGIVIDPTNSGNGRGGEEVPKEGNAGGGNGSIGLGKRVLEVNQGNDIGQKGLETADTMGHPNLGGEGSGGEGGGLDGETKGLEAEKVVIGDGAVGASGGDRQSQFR